MTNSLFSGINLHTISLLNSVKDSMMSALSTRTITLIAPDGVPLHAYLALPVDITAPVAGVIVAPEWWGLTAYPKQRAEQLAALGYAALALDVYGEGKTTEQASQANDWMMAQLGDQDRLMARARTGLDYLASLPEVDSNRLAAIGYCFGGKVALDMAREGMPIKAVVSFHGNLTPKQPALAATFQAVVSIEHGAIDPLVNQEAIALFEAEMQNADIQYAVHQHAGAKHGFTNPDVGRFAAMNGVDFLEYHAQADQDSWQNLQDLLKAQLG
jgi:dienelactone hydrolase